MKWPVWIAAVLLASCISEVAVPEGADICVETGEIVSDRGHILAALEYHFERDEILLQYFPKGAQPAMYASHRLPLSDYAKAMSDDKIKPPFVPAHFRSFKHRLQATNADVTSIDVAQEYLDQFPKCCRAVAPRWVRSGYAPNIGYGPIDDLASEKRWIKDVWIIDNDFNRIDMMWLDLDEYKGGQPIEEDGPIRFMFSQVWSRDDTASTQCGEPYLVTR